MNKTSQARRGTHSARGSKLQDGELLAFQASPGGGPEVRVRVLRPTLHIELADAFEAAHRAALRRHEVDGVIPGGAPLRARTATWLIVAQRPGHDQCCMAGIRLDLREPGQPLPLERVMARFGDPPLALLHDRCIGSVGEFAGLWVQDECRKLGLPALLISAGLAAARLAGLARIFALLPLHTCSLFAAEGFHIIRDLGDDGSFLYPNDRYRSWVMQLDLGHRALVGIGIHGGA
jgi:hypothetical protein